VVEENGGAVGCDLYDVFGGVGVGRLEPGDYGFVEGLAGIFPCQIKDFGETGLGGDERMAEFQEGFGDGAGGGAGEPDDADSTTAGRGGDGYDGVFEDVVGFGVRVAHLDFSMLAGEKKWRGELWCFSVVFAKNRVQDVVFCWCDRGELHGRRGV
jgi:hypothetical protein